MTRIEAIERFISDSKRFKNAYFWNPPLSAKARRCEEKRNSWRYEDEEIILRVDITCTCNNYYFSKEAYIGGKRVTIREVKKLLT